MQFYNTGCPKKSHQGFLKHTGRKLVLNSKINFISMSFKKKLAYSHIANFDWPVTFLVYDFLNDVDIQPILEFKTSFENIIDPACPKNP